MIGQPPTNRCMAGRNRPYFAQNGPILNNCQGEIPARTGVTTRGNKLKRRGTFSTIAVVAILVGVCASRVERGRGDHRQGVQGQRREGEDLEWHRLGRPADRQRCLCATGRSVRADPVQARDRDRRTATSRPARSACSDINPLKRRRSMRAGGRCGGAVNPNRVICETKRREGHRRLHERRERPGRDRRLDHVAGRSSAPATATTACVAAPAMTPSRRRAGHDEPAFGGGGSDRIRLGRG